MLIAFFDIDGVVHHEFVPSGQTVNVNFYVQVLQKLRDAVRRKRRDNWQGEWFLHHDNASSHTSLFVQQFLTEKSIPVITQPPYSPDLAPRLAVPYSENGPQGNTFRNHGGHQIECDGRNPEDSKRSLPPVLPTMAGSVELVCTRARVLL